MPSVRRLVRLLALIPVSVHALSLLDDDEPTQQLYIRHDNLMQEFQRPNWEAAQQKAKKYLQDFTLEEKITLTMGVGWQQDHCVGNIAPIPSRKFPGLCLEDSPTAVRFADFVSVFPGGVNTAATFDRYLMRARGRALGKEFRGKGVHVALGPMMNMGRVPEGGRNFEGFGADPYLAGEAAFETVVGLQSQGVQACAKHYINNEQEHKRRTSTSNVDDRIQHELYLHPFLRSVQAGVASIMCSYNKVNGTYACENDETLNGYLKNELGFEGYVMSDWDASQGAHSANYGLDMTMPGKQQELDELRAAVEEGKVSENRITDMAERIIAAWFLLGQDEGYPEVNFDAFNPLDSFNKHVDVQSNHHELIRDMGAASTVLLKNKHNTLPLVETRSLAVIGSGAGPAKKGPNAFPDRAGLDGILAQGWGSGTGDYPYLISPLEAIQSIARVNHIALSWWLDDWDTEGAIKSSQGKETAIVFVAATSGEEYLTYDGNQGDRKNLTAWSNGDTLVSAVADNHPNTIVVVHSTGPILMPWAEHENVTAIIWAGVPGQEAGNSLVDILWGAWNPSGRLPFTIAKKEEDYKIRILWGEEEVDYQEGLNIDYRWFDANDVEPLYEFGFGLSYTQFEYFGLKVTTVEGFQHSALENWRNGLATDPVDSFGSSVKDWLHQKVWNVEFKVKNVGPVYGGEIPQLYVAHPSSANAPKVVLKGFDRVHLAPDETKDVLLQLSPYDLSIWGTEQQAWVAPEPEAEYTLHIGRSSRDFRLKKTLKL